MERATHESFTSPDQVDEFLPWKGQQSHAAGDLSPISSRYSSCGESEFERYCSANSIMGTPSIRSSSGAFDECFESDFGSMRSLDDFSLRGSFERKFDQKKILSEGRLGRNLNGNMESSSLPKDNHVQSSLGLFVVPDLSTALDDGLYGEDREGRVVSWRDCALSSVMQSSSGNDCMLLEKNAEDVNKNRTNVGFDALNGDSRTSETINQLGGLNLICGTECDITEGGRCSDEAEDSSRYELSEDEESMFGCGTDDEKQINSAYNGYTEYPCNANGKNENALLMTSSTAFGSDDWDDYINETSPHPLVSMVPKDFWSQKQQIIGSDSENLNSTITTSNGFQSLGVPEQQEGVEDTDELTLDIRTCSTKNILKIGEVGKGENAKDMGAKTNQSRGINQSTEFSKIYSLKEGLIIEGDEMEGEYLCTSREEATRIDGGHVSKSMLLEKPKLQLDPPSNVTDSHFHSAPREPTEGRMAQFLEDPKSNSLQLLAENNINRTMKDSPASNHHAAIKAENLDLNDFYNDLVHEMEEILLDSSEAPGARFIQGNRPYQPQMPLPLRDGGSSASTSGSDNAYLLSNRPLRIDRVEVVGTGHKKGDVSLSERLVGVKEYTVYKIRVWSGEDKWEVERRYRDFCTLYRRLKTLFTNQGWILPSPWNSVDRESRKIFGNASPAVIKERSVLIQECLRSVLDSRFSSNLSNALTWFLSPPKADPSSPASTDMPQSPFSARSEAENVSTFGRTISLVVKIRPYKSKKQILEAQHYTCSGCHKHFDDGSTRMWELVQTLGWGKPRLCEYSGQLFCASCHTNETAVLPARVLHLWDFTEYPVSQLAKSYLDSILDQPMLCVSAVNPFLFSKVPALQHVTNVRKRIGAMLPYVRCPFRRTIFKGLGSRRYLLESSDFFALRDLIDLSKGVFAVLPMTVETVSKKILEHITEQCLICCDVGLPCNARQACHDPSSLIFPFQEGEFEKCKSCGLVFHKPCFKKIASCPCGFHFKLDETKRGDAYGTLDLLRTQADSRSSAGFLSGLFSKARPGKLLGRRDSDDVILMGSLPSTSL